ncbi:rna pseudouridine synthase superfamily [Cystoisospora suis]|uniref:Rna pseudouridine synthase superfamily n=1 Tax=Cystoisospora suis TaxID=483139 RepID=A0A2C6KUA6_9APIC|nr:rna pseudouridine synthase superfamily [Cystoisospora suis]
MHPGFAGTAAASTTSGTVNIGTVPPCKHDSCGGHLGLSLLQNPLSAVVTPWVPQTLAQQRRYMVLAPVVRWIFEAAVEKAVVLASGSPESMENHYWYVLRIQYLEKILLLELRHALCEVLADEWLEKYVGPHFSELLLSGAFQLDRGGVVLEEETKKEQGGGGKRKKKKSKADDDEEKLSAAVSFFFRDDEEGGTVAASAAGWERGGANSLRDAVLEADDKVVSNSAEKPPTEKKKKKSHAKQAKKEEKGKGEKTKSTGDGLKSNDLDSPLRFGHRQAAEVISRWARTHLSDNGRLIADELGRVLKDPLNRLVEKISTLRHEVEVLCREGRGRSFRYRAGQSDTDRFSAEGGAATAVVPPGESSGVEAVEEERNASLKHRSGQESLSGKLGLSDAGNAMTSFTEGVSSDRGDGSEDNGGDSSSFVGSAGSAGGGAGTMAELQQAVGDRLADLWACCRSCVMESEAILAEFTLQKFGGRAGGGRVMPRTRVNDSNIEEGREEENRIPRGNTKEEQTTERRNPPADFKNRSSDLGGDATQEDPSALLSCATDESLLLPPEFCPTGWERTVGSLPGILSGNIHAQFASAAAGSVAGGGRPPDGLDHLGCEFDIPVDETVELIAFLAEAFWLPDFRTMRRYLRDRKHLVFERVRPHELIRAYLAVTRPEVDLPALLRESGYDVLWCEAAFQPEDISAIWGDTSLPDVAAVQNACKGFYLPHAVSSVLMHLLVTALECRQETDSGSEAVGKKGKKKRGEGEAEGRKRGREGNHLAPAPTEQQLGSIKAATSTSVSEKADREEGHPISADVEAIIRAMEHDCPDLASSTSTAPAPPLPGSPEPGGVVTPPQASGSVPTERPEDSYVSSTNADVSKVRAASEGPTREILSPAPPLLPTHSPPQSVDLGNAAAPSVPIAPPKIPLTLPIPRAADSAPTGGSKAARKKARGSGFASAAAGDPAQLVPVLDQVLPRLSFDQRLAASADPAVFFLCPAASSSAYSSFAPSPKGGSGAAASTGGSAASPTTASGNNSSLSAGPQSISSEQLGMEGSSIAGVHPPGGNGSSGRSPGGNNGTANGAVNGNLCRRLRYHGLEIGLLLAEDLKGLEGFAIEDRLTPRARLVVRKAVPITGMSSSASTPANPGASPTNSSGTNSPSVLQESLSVQRLYWAFRKLLHSQIEERDVYGREDGNPPPGGSSSGTTTTAGGGGGKGAKNNVFESQQYQQQLSLLQEQGERELWWLPTPRDAFLLYALRPDPDPTRRGRRRFVYMDPLEDVESYVDTKRQWIDATAPDIMILLVAAPQRCCAEAAAWLKGNAVASTSSSSVGSVPSLILPPPALTFPLEDAEDFPLLVFKWFQAESVDLFCVGALVCDAKQQLQTYILDWLLPQVRARGYLTPLPPHTTKDDPESYLVLEECHVRTVQNIRRWSCAIRKINKQGGDIIIVQKKGLIESPASIRYRESSALIEKVRLYEVTHHHHHHCAAGVPGGPANGDFDLDALGSSSLPPLASTVSGDPGTGEFLLDGNPDLIPLLHGDAGSGAGGGIFSHLLEEGGDGEDGAAGGKKKKKKKQKKVLPRAAIPSNKKSVIARLAEDQRREETTLLKAAKDNQHEGDRDDLSLQAPSTTTTASSSSSSASISSSTGTGQEGKSKKKSKVAASSENEEGESMTGSKATSAVASKRSEEGGSALSEERGKDEREEDKENQSSNRKMGAGGSSSSAVSKTSIGSSKAVAGDGKTKSGVGSATSAGARTGRKAAGPSFSLSQTKTASFEDERPSLDSSRTPSVELPSGQQLTSVKGRGVGSLEEAARSLSSSAVQKKGKKSGDEKTLIKEIGGSPTFSTSGGITRKKDSGGMSSPLSSAHQTGTSSPPLSPASSTLSRGSFSSLITLPNSVQSRLSSSALQLLQKLADKQHSVTPSFLRETANVLLRDFLRRISRLYQETEEANKETLGQGGSQTSERKRGDDQSNTSGSSSGIGGGDGSASTASWLVSNGGGAGSVIADEVWECVEALETVCCSCFSTQQRPVFVKELQTLLEHEVVQQQDGDAEGMEERKTPKRGGDSVETKPGSSKASGSGPGTGKARRGSYCGVATPGKGASVSTEEASASDWRLAAFQRLFSFRRRAACELFALLSVARGGQIVTRKLVAQYCLAALDRPETSQNSSRALSSVATVIHMWMFLGPRLLCKLGDSQQGRRFVDAGLKKLFDFFQQRASSALQLQSQHPSFSSVSVFSSSTTSPSSNNSAGVLLPVPAPGELDCGSLIAWAAGVLLKVFHLSRSSQLALPRQTEVSNALQQIQLPSAFCSYTKPQSTSTAPSAWSAGAPLVPLIGENSQYSSGAGGGVHQSGSILGGTADGTQHEQKGAHYHGGQGVLDSTVQTGRSGGNPPLLLPPVTGGLSSGSVTFAGWTSASSPADSSSQGGRKSGMLDDSTAGKKGGARERKSPKHLAGSDGGCESPSSAMVSAVDASDGGRAGGRSGGTKGMSSPTSSTGLRGRLVAAIDEREDSEEEESVEEDESGATMVHQEQELLVGEQSVYGSGKALSKRTFKKAAPYVVEEGSTWMVLYKPAFWHCSGFGRDRPVFVPRVATAQELEEALAHISVEDMVTSGKIESFHLYMMKKYPRMETVRRWEEMECGLCHRTDLETSGSLLIAKTRRARESIFEQFRRRLVHKEYLLLCHGRLDKVYARIDHPIATRDFDSNRSKSHFSEVVGPDEGGDEALTEYQVVRVFGLRQPVHPKIQAAMTVAARLAANATSSGVSSSSSSTGSSGTSTTAGGGVTTSRSAPAATSSGSTKGASPSSSSSTNKKDFTYSQEFSFCRVRIHTGRTHQIRVHFRHIGHPLVGDTKYCDLYKCTVDRSWCARMFLHSAVLEFDNPDKVETQHVRVVCPLAAELLGALEHELVCLEDYSKITTDMIDRNGQIKKEHKHLIVQNSTEPPDGSVPGYTALSAVSSPSSRSSGPLSSSSPPLLPLVPSVSAVVGSNTATPGSPASASHTRGSTGGSNAGGASGGAGEGGTCSPPPVMRSSPAASAATVSGSASYENSKHTEGAPLSGSTPAGTSGILSSGVRSTERLHEEEDTTAKPPTPLLSDSHPDGSSPPSSPQASSRLAQPPPSNRSLSPPSPASTSRGTSSPCPVSSPFSSIFENLYSNAVVLETEARQQEGSQAAALASNEEQRKAVSSRTSLLSLVAEGDWSVGYCDRVDHSNAPRGGETSWSYREYAAGLAGLMHLPRKEEDLPSSCVRVFRLTSDGVTPRRRRSAALPGHDNSGACGRVSTWS